MLCADDRALKVAQDINRESYVFVPAKVHNAPDRLRHFQMLDCRFVLIAQMCVEGVHTATVELEGVFRVRQEICFVVNLVTL